MTHAEFPPIELERIAAVLPKGKSLSEHELALPRPEARRPAGEMHTGRVGHLLVVWALNHPDDKCVRWFSRVFTRQLLPHFPNKRNTCGLSQTPSPSVFDRAHTTNGWGSSDTFTDCSHAVLQEQTLWTQAGKQHLGETPIKIPMQDTYNRPARFWVQLRCPKKYIFQIVLGRRAPECFYRHQNCFEKIRLYIFPVFHVLGGYPKHRVPWRVVYHKKDAEGCSVLLPKEIFGLNMETLSYTNSYPCLHCYKYRLYVGTILLILWKHQTVYLIKAFSPLQLSSE